MAKKSSKKAERSKDRHRARRSVRLPDDLYDLTKILATRKGRSLHDQVRAMLIEELQRNQLWPPNGSASAGG